MPTATYSIERHEHGVIVRGAVPVDELLALSKTWKKEGLTQLVHGIPGASFAVARPEHVGPWLDQLRAEAAKSSLGDPEIAWLHGPDVGSSSLTIFSVLSENHAEHARSILGKRGPSVPLDPEDFGRCYKLLQFFPAWRACLDEVAKAYPMWAPLVRDWAELEALYREELPTGKAPRLYDRMDALLTEAGYYR